MKKETKNKVQKDYIEKLKDWQKHQFDFGYYTGGNIAPIFVDKNEKHYIVVNDGKIKLRCSSSDVFDMWSVKVTEGKAIFDIEYEWNILFPGNGKVVQIIKR